MSFLTFNKDGFIKEFKIELGDYLRKLQDKIYILTKDKIIDHKNDLPIEKNNSSL